MESILSEIRALPPLPAIVYQLTRIIDNPSSSARDLATIISADQSLTARVLRLVNSSYYAFRSKIFKVSHAISLMGFLAVKNVVMSLSLIDAFRKSDNNAGLDSEGFWEHSLGVASTAKAIGEKAGYSSPEEAFIAGLLHDIGKVVLDISRPEEYLSVLKEVAGSRQPIRTIEHEYFGFDHCELGAELAILWNLPPQLSTTIRNHHDPDFDDELTRIVFAANNLCKARRVGFSGDALVNHIPDSVWRPLDISKKSLLSIFSEMKKEVLKTRIFLDMGENDARNVKNQQHQIPPNAYIMVASNVSRLLNVVQLILEEDGFFVKLSEIPIRMTPDEKRMIRLIVLDNVGNEADFPEKIEVKVDESASRIIPILKISNPIESKELVDSILSHLAKQPESAV